MVNAAVLVSGGGTNLQALLDAKANLTEKPQENWVGSFGSLNSSFGPIGEILYADWSYADQYPIDLSSYGDRSGLRLQFTVTFQSSDPSVDPADVCSSLVFKLRSPDTDGKENNIGWECSVSEFSEKGSISVSIPLDQAGKHVSNQIDWSKIERMILFCYLNEPYKADAAKYSMKISTPRIVDITPIEQIQQQIRTELERTVDRDGADEQAVQAYEQARQAAQQAAEASVDSVDLYDVTKALEQLKAAIEALS